MVLIALVSDNCLPLLFSNVGGHSKICPNEASLTCH